MGANSFDNIFCLFHLKALGNRYLWYGDACQTVGVVTDATAEMDMTGTVSSVVMMANAVFLRPATIVYAVQKMAVAEKSQCPEQCRPVDCR